MKNYTIIDVREKDEFLKEHIRNSVDVPLSFLETREERFVKLLHGKNILLMCRSGKRSTLAYGILKKHFDTNNLSVYEGGIVRYAQEHPEEIVKGRWKISIPLMGQVQVALGVLIALFLSLALTLSIDFLYPIAFISAGLIYAGLSGNCLLALVLSKLPFNRQ